MGKSSTDRSSSSSKKSKVIFSKFKDHSIIIKVDGEKEVAVNPKTDKPYVVWFVNNSSSNPGKGTFKHPFNMLVFAQNSSNPNDIIYVFPGNGTDKGQNAGITMKKGQDLLGANFAYRIQTTVGCIKIPAQAEGRPTISNTFAVIPISPGNPIGRASVRLLAGDNVVSGFNLLDTLRTGTNNADFTSGLRIDAGLNYLIKDNIMTSGSSLVEGGNSMNLHGGGNVKMINNTFINSDTGDTYGIDAFPYVSPFQGYYVFEDNLFTGISVAAGLDQGLHFELHSVGTDGSPNFGYIGNISVSMISNTFNSQTNTAHDNPGAIVVNCNPNLENIITVNIIGNNAVIPTGIAGARAGIFVAARGPGPLSVNLHKNVMLTTPPTPGYFFNNFGDPANLRLDMGFDNFGTSLGP